MATAGGLLAVFTLLGLFYASERYLRVLADAGAAPAPRLWVFVWPNVLRTWIWLLFTPLVLRLYRRFPLTGGAGGAATAVAHVTGAILIPPAALLANVVVFFLVLPGASMAMTPFEWLESTVLSAAGFFHLFLLVYTGIVATAFAFDFHGKARAKELAEARLSTQLSEARLKALRMQLHPHFLFNTLNTVLPLIYRDPDTATRTMVRLGDLVRQSLRNDGALVPLEEELGFLRKYLEIESTRFGDRLRVDYRIDPGALPASVPNLLLQPVVENAIKHGISARPGAGRIEIEARRDGGWLELAVHDDGPGLSSGPAPPGEARRGVGVANTRGRLASLFGARHRFELVNREGGGVSALFRIPFAPGETA